MANNHKNIAQTVKDLVQPVADEFGYFLWDVEYVKEGARRILRITIDAEDGITIDDCEKFHRAVDPLLDAADPIEEAYYLEVSSPGIERELRTDEHITACEGWDVEARLYAPRNGKKIFRGKLGAYFPDEGKIILNTPDGEEVFERSELSTLRTYFEF